MCKSCSQMFYHEGHKTYSAYVPDNCQGAYFPGDEPGYRCRATNSSCTDPDGDHPTECDGAKPTFWLCPKCLAKNTVDPQEIMRNGRGVYFCPECGATWTREDDLARETVQAFRKAVNTAADLQGEYDELEEAYVKLEHTLNERQVMLSKIGRLVPEELLPQAV